MYRRHHLAELRASAPAILPSLLRCDFGNLAREVARLEEAGVGGLHLDVMDGNFVPNLTYGMPIVEGIRGLTELPLDVHLMIDQPQRYARQFFEAGADIITFHVEAVGEPRELLEQIRGWGAGAGLALNPSTPLARLEGCLDVCDLVLVMSVEAGFGGQEFQPVALDRLRWLRETAGDRILLEVDGGVNERTVCECAQSGAQLLVVGSAIFRQQEYPPIVKKLTELSTI